MSAGEPKKTCLSCDRGSDETPLIGIEFQGEPYSICPQHLPLLIHAPQKLVGKLPGAEKLAPAKDPH
jgi:hypothetical protein